MMKSVSVTGLAALLLLAFAESVFAINICGTAGRIIEFSPVAANFVIHLTDNMKKIIPQADLAVRGQPLPGGGFGAGRDVVAGQFDGQVCDAENDTIIAMNGMPLPPPNPNDPVPGGQNGGAAAVLSLESIFFDQSSNQILIEGIFATIANKVGVGVPVLVPDLYADTNGNGVLGDGDVLFSLVDLNTYLNSPPSFSLGQTFNVVNGLVSSLPDMIFSTTPFVYDPSLTTSVFGGVNFGGPPGFSGTPFNGSAVAVTQHELTGVPEPSGGLLLGTGLVGLALWFQRKVRN